MAASVGVFRSMFNGISGNSVNKSSRRSILFFYVFIGCYLPNGAYSSRNVGSYL
jgi:hypothetical protein